VWVAAEEECTYKTVKLTVEHLYVPCLYRLHVAILKFVGVVGVRLGIRGLSYNYARVLDGETKSKVCAKEKSLAQACSPNK